MSFGRNQIIKAYLGVVFLYVTSIVGAGFASGQEVLLFFVKYGQDGFVGVLCAGILFCTLAFMIIRHRVETVHLSYEEWLTLVFGRFKFIYHFTVQMFLLFVIALMISAGTSMISNSIDISASVAKWVVVTILFLLWWQGAGAILKCTTWLGPIQLLGMLLATGIILQDKYVQTFGSGEWIEKISNSPYVVSLIYVGCNCLLGVGVLANMKLHISSTKALPWAGLAGGIIITALMLLMYFSLAGEEGARADISMPLLSLLQQVNETYGSIYGVVIFLSVLLSAMISGEVLIGKAQDIFKVSREWCILLVLSLSIVISQGQFQDLMQDWYPRFGYIGTSLLLYLLLRVSILRTQTTLV